jgi:D-alanine-D-alanine ligase
MRVLHLVGSPVSDFFCDLSRLYARDCLETTADPARDEPVIAYVTSDAQWRFPADLSREAIDAAQPMPLAEAVGQLHADIAVPQMFCPPGMTDYRALLDLLEIPYVGNPPDAMALATHKARARAVVAAAGVDVPDGELLRPGERPAVDPPAVVKPVDVDNSLGVTLVRDRADYDRALDAAFAHAGEALVERYVELGREVRCGIVVHDGELVCLPLEEYAVDGVRTPGDKLARDRDGELQLVAKDRSRAWIVDAGDPVTERVWEAARRCHAALGCRHYSLFDFRVDPDGRPWFLEAGLYCSFARKSVICTMTQATGVDPAELFRRTLATALSPPPSRGA